MYLKQGVPFEGASPGAVVAVQTFGDFLNFNPHLHILAADSLARVMYQAKDGNSSKTFLALDWLA